VAALVPQAKLWFEAKQVVCTRAFQEHDRPRRARVRAELRYHVDVVAHHRDFEQFDCVPLARVLGLLRKPYKIPPASTSRSGTSCTTVNGARSDPDNAGSRYHLRVRALQRARGSGPPAAKQVTEAKNN